MKPHTLPVKRRPVPKGILRRLSAVTGNRKQRVAATADSELELEDGSSKISRALTIIFLIHIVAICLIFVHQKFLDGRPADEGNAVAKLPVVAATPRRDLPQIPSTEKPYFIGHGDNYAIIAAKLNVSEDALREINNHADLAAGMKLRVPPQIDAPAPKRVIAQEPPELQALRNPQSESSDDGLVDAVDKQGAPRAIPVKGIPQTESRTSGEAPKTTPKAAVKVTPKSPSSGKSHTVQSGDSIWRIANRYKVDQNALMKANGISDPRKIKPGMSLKIP